MRIVTDSLVRLSRAVSIAFGVTGVSLAAAFYLFGSASGIVTLAMGAYAVGFAAVALLFGAQADARTDRQRPTTDADSRASNNLTSGRLTGFLAGRLVHLVRRTEVEQEYADADDQVRPGR